MGRIHCKRHRQRRPSYLRPIQRPDVYLCSCAVSPCGVCASSRDPSSSFFSLTFCGARDDPGDLEVPRGLATSWPRLLWAVLRPPLANWHCTPAWHSSPP